MKKKILILTLSFLVQFAFSQQKEATDKNEITKVLNTFMNCLVKKDSVQFYNLFHKDPITWVGVTQKKSHLAELKKDSTEKNYFSATYKQFYRSFFKTDIEEKFYNVVIIHDGYIASVTFNYSFWYKNKKSNWGKESWGLIKTNGQWKITSVIFSTEDEAINPESNNKTKK